MAIPKRFLGAFKAGHRPSTREFIDEDLSKQLLSKIKASNWTDKEAIAQLNYITKFNNEFHKNVVKKGDPNALHGEQLSNELRTDRWGNIQLDKNGNPIPLNLRQTCYARENAKNRDTLSVQLTERKDVQYPTPFLSDNYEPEDILIEFIDADLMDVIIEELKKKDN